MPADQTSKHDFNDSADKGYEKSQLPDILRRKVEYLEDKAEQKKESRREQQELHREEDLAEARARLQLEHLQKDFDTPTVDGAKTRRSAEEIESLAGHEVDRRNEMDLATIDQHYAAKIDAVLEINRDAASLEEKSTMPDLLNSNADCDIGGDFYRASGHAR